MISAAHEDERPTTTVPAEATVVTVAPLAPTGIPTARRAPEDAGSPAAPASTGLTPVPLDAMFVGGPAAVERDEQLDRVAVELAVDAAAVTWALRLALLGVVGLVVLLTILL